MRAPSTPSSLKWLIDRRTRIAGEIEKIRKQEAERLLQVTEIIQKAQGVVKKLEDENATASRLHDKHVQAITQALAATDLLLREHEIPIDPKELPSVHAHTTPRIAGRSKLTQYIFEALARTEKPSLTTTEVAVYVATKLEVLDHDGDAFPEFKYQVRKRLGHLVWEGRLDRLHLPKTSVEGRWRLLIKD
ncbi:hypothetical protein MCEMSHM24_03705 [Comamonadaceae bacterium]